MILWENFFIGLQMFCKFVHSKKHLRCKNMFILYRITDNEFTELLITTEFLTLQGIYINSNEYD